MLFLNYTKKLETNQIALNTLLIITFTLVSIFGSPFLYDQVNSGRQLTTTLRKIDPDLFPDDYVVKAFDRYRSLFYDGLSILARALNFEPARLESLLHILYLLSRFAIVAAFFYISRALNENIWLFVLLAAWSCHPKSIPVGGPGGGAWVFQPLLTHNDVAFIILMFSLYFLLKRNCFIFWMLASITIFVHSLYALHFTLCVIPFILYAQNDAKKHWLGTAMFVLCCIAYIVFYAPLQMTPEEERIFLEAEGESGHISLFSQNLTHWMRIITLATVSILSYLNFTKNKVLCNWLIKSAVSGALICILLSITATYTQSVLISLFQPMRMFIWITLFFYIVLIDATVEAFSHSAVLGMALSGVLFFTTIYSPWALVMGFISIGFMVWRLFIEKDWKKDGLKLEKGLKLTLCFTSTILILSLVIKGATAFISLRNFILIFSSTLCLLLLISKRYYAKYNLAVAAIFISSALLITSFDRHEYYNRSINKDWTQIRRWSQINTAKTDRFITPPEENTFRSIALRTSVSERNVETVWASPFSYVKNKAYADIAAKGYGSHTSDIEYLFQLARQWKCNYVVSKGDVVVKEKPVYAVGEYRIFKVPNE